MNVVEQKRKNGQAKILHKKHVDNNLFKLRSRKLISAKFHFREQKPPRTKTTSMKISATLFHLNSKVVHLSRETRKNVGKNCEMSCRNLTATNEQL